MGWQSCQHPSERDAPHLKSQAHAQRQTRCDRPVPDRNGRKSGHASHGATWNGRGASVRGHARPVQRGLRRPGVPGPVHRRACRVGGPRGTARSSVGSCYHGSQRRRDRRVRTSVRKDTEEFPTDGLRLVPKSKWRIERARRELSSGHHRCLETPGRRRALQQPIGIRHRPKLRHGARSAGQEHSCAGHVANWRRVVW